MATCPVCGNELEDHAIACPHCGFKLVDATQKFEPIDLQAANLIPKPIEKAKAKLHVVRGPQTGVVFTLGDKPLTVGRSPQCDIFLNDMTVSRTHAVIEPTPEGGHLIRDDHSFNGVWVDNRSIDEHRLADGDVVQIGAFCLVYKED